MWTCFHVMRACELINHGWLLVFFFDLSLDEMSQFHFTVRSLFGQCWGGCRAESQRFNLQSKNITTFVSVRILSDWTAHGQRWNRNGCNLDGGDFVYEGDKFPKQAVERLNRPHMTFIIRPWQCEWVSVMLLSLVTGISMTLVPIYSS